MYLNMKVLLTISSLVALPVFLSSCAAPTSTNGTGTNAGGVYQDPNNPYAVPGVTTQGQNYGAATQAPAAAPYQPIPSTPINPPASIPSYTPPVASTPTAATGGGSHTVSSGETLWGLSQKYNVSVDALRQANGISGSNIGTGQTLIIPN